MKYIIKTHCGWVVRFNSAQCIIQVTTTTEKAKRFWSVEAAKRFIARYGDIGYGLVSGTCVIETI